MIPSMALASNTVLHILLLLWRLVLVQCQSEDSTCTTFFGDVLGSDGSLTSHDIFTCNDAYVTRVKVNYGWWIDALQVVCSNGVTSEWFGDGEDADDINEESVDTRGGLTSISSYFKLHDDHNFPCSLTFLAYTGDVEESAIESEIGPYGSCGRSYSSTSPTSQWDTVSGEFNGTSDCGLDAYAIGFFVHYDDEFIYGLGLQCRTITAACPAPDGVAVPYTLPAPVEPTVELGGDCSEYSCVEDLCCSEDHICGATASFCRRGRCCRTQDDSDCTAGLNQCLTEEETEDQWYDTPTFIGTSTAVGLVITVGGACYAVYRHFRERRARELSLPWKRGASSDSRE